MGKMTVGLRRRINEYKWMSEQESEKIDKMIEALDIDDELLLHTRFETLEVSGFQGAIVGMREPMNSHDRMDSIFAGEYIEYEDDLGTGGYVADSATLGDNDLDLCKRLIGAGAEHRKFLRMIHVQVEIKAPRYWWEECATYKIGTVFNSQSTMHKLLNSKDEITKDNFAYYFSLEPYYEIVAKMLDDLRVEYLETKNSELLIKAKHILPESYLQKRVVDLNYEVIRNICKQRKGHKLVEWKHFIDWAKLLPYAKELIFYEKETKGETNSWLDLK